MLSLLSLPSRCAKVLEGRYRGNHLYTHAAKLICQRKYFQMGGTVYPYHSNILIFFHSAKLSLALLFLSRKIVILPTTLVQLQNKHVLKMFIVEKHRVCSLDARVLTRLITNCNYMHLNYG